MRRQLTGEDVPAAMIGGLLLSAGGSSRTRSLERHDLAADVALGYGEVTLASLDTLPEDGYLLVSTSVGAPGFAEPELHLRDHVEAARTLVARIGRRPAGVICGHVPGFNAWLVAAALDIPYVDAAANGRGHPTVKMGGMGLASRSDISIIQVAQAGYAESGSRLSVVAEGNLVKTSQTMRHAAMISGGLVASARGPYEVGFVAHNGASGAIGFQLALGEAMLGAAPGIGRIEAATRFLSGENLLTGTVTANDVAYRDGFDVGYVTVSHGTRSVRLGVFNEFMTADDGDERRATFPDLICALEPDTGEPLAIAQMPIGTAAAIVIADRRGFPLGQGVFDPLVFREVEGGLETELYAHLDLNGEKTRPC
ncbi:DUF917 family protein [Sphingomonas sp. CGMCC 1.13654]|uniref:DUF917 family protein n=1 Tax=Sphingomonas chungangi TaxID=2683589 RepID=A0A838L220_9SPHN|nr:DUF917 family protein [Sphingomonas chungangi]MBA2933543.1 DUF917 family protein [Sphingomonas chungangi]MVW54876.1 DUF917 family protein [Sphingomonas chungangi]